MWLLQVRPENFSGRFGQDEIMGQPKSRQETHNFLHSRDGTLFFMGSIEYRSMINDKQV